MKRYIKNTFMIAVAIALSVSIGRSQGVYKIEDTKAVEMKLLGTSTLHKWEMDASSVEGEADFVFGSGAKLESLKSLSFALAVKDLKSDSKGLDKNAYKALKTDEFKDIHYKLESSTITSAKDGYLLNTKGKLTIAGVTKEVDMKVHAVVNKNGSVTCTGSDKLNMTDYNVKPPTFMLGAMKTGDEITLDFKIIYKKQKGV